MFTIIQARDFSLTEALRLHAERRLGFALSAFESFIQKVKMRLSDVNGPRGGEDKRCQLHIVLNGLPDVIVENTESDMYVAIDCALQKGSRAVKRTISRHQSITKQNGSLPFPADEQK